MKGALANAIYVALAADANLADLVGTRIYDDPPRGEERTFPYVVIADRTSEETGSRGAMQLESGDVRITLHVWGKARGAALEVEPIQRRIREILGRGRGLQVDGFTLIRDSLVCENELCVPDRDDDMPDQSLYHGVQQWVGQMEASA